MVHVVVVVAAVVVVVAAEVVDVEKHVVANSYPHFRFRWSNCNVVEVALFVVVVVVVNLHWI